MRVIKKISVFTLLFCLIYFKFIFNHYSYLFDGAGTAPNADFLIAYLPYINKLSDMSLYLFFTGLGQNVFALKGAVLDPFHLFYLINYQYAPILSFYAKSLLIFLLMYEILEIKKVQNEKIKTIFSAIFAFSGMFTYWGSQDFNFTAITFIILLWYGFELSLMKESAKYLFICSLPLFFCVSIYWVILSFIFLVPYFVYQLFLANKLNFETMLFKYAFSMFLALLLCAATILPELAVLSSNKRVNLHLSIPDILSLRILNNLGVDSIFQYYTQSLAQIFLRALGGIPINFEYILKSPSSGPLLYSSLLIIVLSLSNAIKNYKTQKFGIILYFASLVLAPYLSFIFSGFSDNTFRWTWLYLLPIFVVSVKFLDSISASNFRVLKITTMTLFMFYLLTLFIEYKLGYLDFKDKVVLINNIGIVVVFFLLYVIYDLRVRLEYKVLLLCVISLFDVLYNDSLFIYQAKAIDDTIPLASNFYHDATVQTVKFINKNDKEFFRIDKNYYSNKSCVYCGLNENLMQNYYGLKTYSPLNPNYQMFSADMDAKPYYNFIFGFDGRYDVLRMLGVKYLLSKQKLEMNGYLLANKVDDVYTYQAKNYQGIGHVFHKYLKHEDFLTLSTAQKDLAFSRCTILDNKQASLVKIESVSAQDCVSMNSVLNNNTENFKLKQLNGRNVSGLANLLTNGVLYLAIPYDYGFSAKVDGKSVPVLNVSDGFIGLDLDAGQHEIELNYFPPLFKIGLIISGLTLLALIIYGSIKKTIRIKKKDE